MYAGAAGHPKEGLYPQGVATTRKVQERAGLKIGPDFFNKHYRLSLFFLVLALMSKPMAVNLRRFFSFLTGILLGTPFPEDGDISSFAENLPSLD